MFYSYNPGYESSFDNFCDYNYEENRELKNNKENLILKIGGSGSVKAAPDIAVAFIGVISEDKELSKAQEDNAVRSKKVVDAIMNLGIPERDIKTESFSITPEYDFIEGKQVFRGYRVNNNLQITIRNINEVGSVIDTAVAAGANAVYNINFAIVNREKIYERALSLAIRDAVSKAESIEKTLNVVVDSTPIEITEEDAERISPKTELYSLQSPAAATPIKSGEIEIVAKIRAIFNYKKL